MKSDAKSDAKNDADIHGNPVSGRAAIRCSGCVETPLFPSSPPDEFDELTAGLSAAGRAEWIGVLQTALGVTVDGIYGPVTQRALSDYKIAVGLTAPVPHRGRAGGDESGNARLAGEITRLAGQLHAASQGEQVQLLQRALGLPDNGVFDAFTVAALADFRIASKAAENLGLLVWQLRSGQRSVFTISCSRSDPLVGSYGVHQLASATGIMSTFVASPENAAFSESFAGLVPGSALFNEMYLQVATDDPAGFAQAQHHYMTRMHYVPVLRYAANLGVCVSDRGVQETLYSQSVQYGHSENLIMLDQMMMTAPGISSEPAAQQIGTLYAMREVCFGRLASSEKYHQELQRALRISDYFQRFFKMD